MKWDGFIHYKEIKKFLLSLLNDEERKIADTVDNARFVRMLKKNHANGETLSLGKKGYVKLDKKQLYFTFRADIYHSVTDITVPWRDAAWYIRMWSSGFLYEKNKQEDKKTMSFNITDMLAAPQNGGAAANTIITADLNKLVSYHNHQFKLYEGERLTDMIQSIKQNGVLVPIIVMEITEQTAGKFKNKAVKEFYKANIGKYEILSGHNRANAAKEAGLRSIPAVVKTDISEADAENYVYETNLLQRGFNDLSVSEQAAVIAHRHSTMFDKSKAEAIRGELSCLEKEENSEENPESAVYIGNKENNKLATVGKEYSLSRNSVARLLRVNKLIPELKQSIDLSLLPVRAGVELSYISEAAQKAVFEYYKKPAVCNDTEYEVIKINIDKSNELRGLLEDFKGDEQAALKKIIDFNEKEDEKPKNPKPFKLKAEVLSKYFSEDENPDYMTDIIDAALKMYFEREKQESEETA